MITHSLSKIKTQVLACNLLCNCRKHLLQLEAIMRTTCCFNHSNQSTPHQMLKAALFRLWVPRGMFSIFDRCIFMSPTIEKLRGCCLVDVRLSKSSFIRFVCSMYSNLSSLNNSSSSLISSLSRSVRRRLVDAFRTDNALPLLSIEEINCFMLKLTCNVEAVLKSMCEFRSKLHTQLALLY